MSVGPLEATATLACAHLDDLQFAVEGVDLGGDVEDSGVGVVIAGDLRRQTPVIGAAGQLCGLMIGGRLASDGVDEPHGEWLCRGVADVGGGGIQVVLENRVAFLSQGAEGEGDRAVSQFNVSGLAHNAIAIRDDEVGESAMVFLEPIGALCVGLAGHLGAEVGELLAKLLDLGFGLEMLKGAANGRVGQTNSDSAEGAGIQLWMPLHSVERALRGKGIVMVVDAGDDFAFLCIRVGGDGEVGAFDGGVNRFGSRWVRRGSGDGVRDDAGFCLSVGEMGRSGRWVHECDGGGTELGLGRDDFNAVAEDGGVGHAVVLWKYW